MHFLRHSLSLSLSFTVRSLTSAIMLPAPPSKVLNQFGLKLQSTLALDLQEILSEQQAEDENRSQSFDLVSDRTMKPIFIQFALSLFN